jgi:hypothetical protein
VVTSRVADPSCWGRHARIVAVGPLADDDATQVLLDRAPHAGDASQARTLAQQLGGWPLGLQTAGSYLALESASVTSFHGYAAELDQPSQTPRMLTETPELRAYVGDRGTPIRTFEISLDDLSRRGVPQARHLLRLLSCYASPTPIPRSLLRPRGLRGILTADGEAGIQNELEHGLQQLRHVSLVEFGTPPERGTGARDVALHPVVAAASRAHLRADDDPLTDAALIRRMSVGLMATAIGQLDRERPADWPAFVRLGPHVHALFQAVADQVDEDSLRDLIVATTDSALAHHSYGAVTEAMRLAEIAQNKLSRLRGDDEGSLWARHHLAWFLAVMGRPEQAEALFRKVLAIREQALGPEHPDTLWTRHELAWIAASEGHWAAAEAAYRAVLEARRRTLGDEHQDTLMAFHELGWVVANQGRAQEAAQMLTQVLAARCRVLGEEHPRTLWTRHELAGASPSRDGGPKPSPPTKRYSKRAAVCSAPTIPTSPRRHRTWPGRSRLRGAMTPPLSFTRKYSPRAS